MSTGPITDTHADKADGTGGTKPAALTMARKGEPAGTAKDDDAARLLDRRAAA